MRNQNGIQFSDISPHDRRHCELFHTLDLTDGRILGHQCDIGVYHDGRAVAVDKNSGRGQPVDGSFTIVLEIRVRQRVDGFWSCLKFAYMVHFTPRMNTV